MADRGLSSKVLREMTAAARRMARERAAARHDASSSQFPDAAQVARRVFNAAVEAQRTGESGDVSPLLWAPLVVAGEMMAHVVVAANPDLPQDEETMYDVAAYFVASFIAGGHGFDRAHFEGWKERAWTDPASEVEPG